MNSPVPFSKNKTELLLLVPQNIPIILSLKTPQKY